MPWIALAIAVLANVITNVSLKLAVKKVAVGPVEGRTVEFLLQPWTWVGLCAGLVLLGSYIVAIRSISLGVSYAVVTTFSLVFITIAASYVLQERITPWVLLGIGLIIVGIFILVTVEVSS